MRPVSTDLLVNYWTDGRVALSIAFSGKTKSETRKTKSFTQKQVCQCKKQDTAGCIFINDLPLCLTRASVQCDLFADDGTLNTANDNIDNIL